jgi:acetone carboxylase gamma subunit
MTSQPDEDDNWLNGAYLTCAGCQGQIYRIDHSPLYDCYFLYCDRCPMRVDISYYDPVLASITADGYEQLMQAIEVRLQHCECGGRFGDNAPRRCYRCHTILDIDSPSGIDVWPAVWPDADEPSPAEQEIVEKLTRTNDLWS